MKTSLIASVEPQIVEPGRLRHEDERLRVGEALGGSTALAHPGGFPPDLSLLTRRFSPGRLMARVQTLLPDFRPWQRG